MVLFGEAYIVDTFYRMLKANFCLPDDLAWEIIHNVNSSKTTLPFFDSVDYYTIHDALSSLEKTAVYIYKTGQDLPEVKIHSIHQEWKTVIVTYINNKYKFKILETNEVV